MNRRSLSTTLFLVTAGLIFSGLFSSCIKEDFLKNENGDYVTDSLGHKVPDGSSIIYLTQEIPDINLFIPDILLKNMNQIGALHFGTEPPKIDGKFMADTLSIYKTLFMPGSHYQNFVDGKPIGGGYGFTLSNQLWSVTSLSYSKRCQIDNMFFYECSTDDSTHQILKDNLEMFKANSVTPPYFKGDNFNVEEFQNTYLIGDAPYFTIFFYQVVRIEITTQLPFEPKDFHPILANVISGKYNKYEDGTPYITEFYWGRQCIGYINTGNTLNMAINQGIQPSFGDAWICNNSGMPVHFVNPETTDNE